MAGTVSVGGTPETVGDCAYARTGRHGEGSGEECAEDFAGYAWECRARCDGTEWCSRGTIVMCSLGDQFSISMDTFFILIFSFFEKKSLE